jgi:hypothetical protein
MAEFIGITFGLLAIVLLIVFRSPKKAWDFLKVQKGVTKGIVIVLVVIPLIALIIEKAAAKDIEYFNYAYVYTGLDFGKKRLPNCYAGDNEYIVSNVGFGLNILETDRTTLNAKYTHHSCAFHTDYWSYDAVGVEVRYTIPFGDK